MSMCLPSRRAAMALAVALVGVAPARAQSPSPITASGRGVLKGLSPTEGESLGLEIRMQNASGGPVRVTRAEAFLACQGGWSDSLGETIARDGKFFGNDPTLGPGSYSYEFSYGFSTPVSHYVLALQLEQRGRPRHDFLLQVPFVRPGFPAPRALHASAPVFIGLQEPLEVITLASGQSWLTIVGQVVNTSGKPLTLKRWHLRIKDGAGKAEVDRELTDLFRIEASPKSLNEFFFGFFLPKDFRSGTLEIDAEVELGGPKMPLVRTAEVARVEAHAVKPPVDGRWSWGNGPGQLAFHTHYHYPEQRYCYDMGIRGGPRRGPPGGPDRNEGYACWDMPIHCVEDGKVMAVVDNVPDNFGHRTNPANRGGRNSCVLVDHGGGHFSEYYHVRQGSATVKVGQSVKVGDVLARVGNAGQSSEPHLHFGYLGLDPTGRFRNIPVRIEGLKTVDGKPADGGVPRGGVEYVSGPAR